MSDLTHGVSAYRSGRCRCDVCLEGHNSQCQKDRSRWRAERVLIDGRWTYPAPPEEHGTPSAHLYKNKGCRCEPCTQAMQAWQNSYRARRKQWRKVISEMSGAA